jgi:UDP-GlcNAc:undecaprenyl-phosphate/decaprenyl-phosphate GlcNAc-1-phosphate transferase
MFNQKILFRNREVGKINRIIPATAYILISLLWFIPANAGTNPDPAVQKGESQSVTPGQSSQNAASDSEKAPDLKTLQDRINYAIGVNLIANFKKQGIDIDLNLVTTGMQDALAGRKLPMTDEELRQCISYYQTAARQNQSKAMATASNNNKKEGEAFLSENRKKDGVVTLPSGLQYRIIKAGDGKKPADDDSVACHYRGTLINGTEFDSSYKTGHPATFKVNGVIPGWREALKLMPVGSKWQVFVPSQLAYGERGKGPSIGPNAALIFEVELIAIK